MRGSFRTGVVESLRITPALLSTVRLIGEYKGKQDLYKRTAPAVLDTLTEVARIQSVESSNRIEGITADQPRLRALIAQKTTPADRSEAWSAPLLVCSAQTSAVESRCRCGNRTGPCSLSPPWA